MKAGLRVICRHESKNKGTSRSGGLPAETAQELAGILREIVSLSLTAFQLNKKLAAKDDREKYSGRSYRHSRFP
jgi:hypothetical protein